MKSGAIMSSWNSVRTGVLLLGLDGLEAGDLEGQGLDLVLAQVLEDLGGDLASRG